jgi:GNAT superfamily N-acetyltransferase
MTTSSEAVPSPDRRTRPRALFGRLGGVVLSSDTLSRASPVRLPSGYRHERSDNIGRGEAARLMRSVGWPVSYADLKYIEATWRAHRVHTLEVGVRDASDELVGFGGIVYIGTSGELCDLVVKEEHQHHGIGRYIVAARLEMAEAADITSLYMPYLEETNTLEPYYRENGFVRTDLGELVLGPNPVSITKTPPKPNAEP